MLHYLIVAHKNPQQIATLVERIQWDDTKIYLHLDGYADIAPFLFLKDKVTFIKQRVKVRWGWYSVVQAYFNGMKEILPEMEEGEHLVICSWECYPIKSNEYIKKFLSKYPSKSFIDADLIEKWSDKGKERYEKYKFYDLVIPSWIDKIFSVPIVALWEKLLTSSCEKLRNIWTELVIAKKTQVFHVFLEYLVNFFCKKKTYIPSNYKVYKGSCLMVLTKQHIQYLLDFEKDKKNNQFFQEAKTSSIMDEVVIHTILLNSIHKKDILQESLWFMDRKKWACSPETIGKEHLEKILDTDKLFTRKVDLGYYNLDSILEEKKIYSPDNGRN